MKLLVTAGVLFLLQCTLAESVSLGGGGPDLLLTMAVFCALFIDGEGRGAAACWTLGLVKDIGCSGLFGGFSLLFLMLWYGVARVKEYLFREDIPTQFVVTFVIGLAVNLLYAVMGALLDAMPGFFSVLQRCAIVALWTAVVAPPLIWLLSRIVFSARTVDGGIRL